MFSSLTTGRKATLFLLRISQTVLLRESPRLQILKLKSIGIRIHFYFVKLSVIGPNNIGEEYF